MALPVSPVLWVTHAGGGGARERAGVPAGHRRRGPAADGGRAPAKGGGGDARSGWGRLGLLVRVKAVALVSLWGILRGLHIV